MIEHAPKKGPPATRPRLESEDERLEEGLEESFPASDTPTSVMRHQPVWDQRPETD
jgi:hypothetical protein